MLAVNWASNRFAEDETEDGARQQVAAALRAMDSFIIATNQRGAGRAAETENVGEGDFSQATGAAGGAVTSRAVSQAYVWIGTTDAEGNMAAANLADGNGRRIPPQQAGVGGRFRMEDHTVLRASLPGGDGRPGPAIGLIGRATMVRILRARPIAFRNRGGALGEGGFPARARAPGRARFRQ